MCRRIISNITSAYGSSYAVQLLIAGQVSTVVSYPLCYLSYAFDAVVRSVVCLMCVIGYLLLCLGLVGIKASMCYGSVGCTVIKLD